MKARPLPFPRLRRPVLSCCVPRCSSRTSFRASDLILRILKVIEHIQSKRTVSQQHWIYCLPRQCKRRPNTSVAWCLGSKTLQKPTEQCSPFPIRLCWSLCWISPQGKVWDWLWCSRTALSLRTEHIAKRNSFIQFLLLGRCQLHSGHQTWGNHRHSRGRQFSDPVTCSAV